MPKFIKGILVVALAMVAFSAAAEAPQVVVYVITLLVIFSLTRLLAPTKPGRPNFAVA
jgi:hypothetical protein